MLSLSKHDGLFDCCLRTLTHYRESFNPCCFNSR
jgi:hypothetical protein